MGEIGNFKYSVGSYFVDEDAYAMLLYYKGEGFGEILFYDEEPNKRMSIEIYPISPSESIKFGFVELEELLKKAREEFEWIIDNKKIDKKIF